jgi:pyroglutamyl-peptidase
VTRVLVTSFEPFGGSTVNASAEAVALLPERIGDADIVRSTLPCVFDEAPSRLASLIDDVAPDIIIAVGEAGGRSSVDLERVAVNLDDARIADNAGRRPIDRTIIEGAPLAYLSGLPVKACAAAVDAVGVASGVSNSAGTFVCNHVFFALMHLLHEQPARRGGLVHVPTVDRMAAADSATALAAVIDAAIRVTVDIRVSRGTES